MQVRGIKNLPAYDLDELGRVSKGNHLLTKQFHYIES